MGSPAAIAAAANAAVCVRGNSQLSYVHIVKKTRSCWEGEEEEEEKEGRSKDDDGDRMGENIGKQLELAVQAFKVIDDVVREIVKKTGGIHDCSSANHAAHGELSSWERNKMLLIYAGVALLMFFFFLPALVTGWTAARGR